jgi:hypothetical protein
MIRQWLQQQMQTQIPFGDDNKGQATATTKADPYGMTTKRLGTALDEDLRAS